MKPITTEKKFKIIELSQEEVKKVFLTHGICDSCNSMQNKSGYYIAVLNQWFCTDCFLDWHKSGAYYPEDAKVENRNYQYVLNKCEMILK